MREPRCESDLGRKVRIEVKLDAKDFDNDPTKIDVLICWEATLSGNLLKQIASDKFSDNNNDYKSSKAMIWALTYNISEEQKNCSKSLNSLSRIISVKDIFRCVRIEVIELKGILRLKVK